MLIHIREEGKRQIIVFSRLWSQRKLQCRRAEHLFAPIRRNVSVFGNNGQRQAYYLFYITQISILFQSFFVFHFVLSKRPTPGETVIGVCHAITVVKWSHRIELIKNVISFLWRSAMTQGAGAGPIKNETTAIIFYSMFTRKIVERGMLWRAGVYILVFQRKIPNWISHAISHSITAIHRSIL